VVHVNAAHIAILALAGMVAGAINAMAGGGSLISFPALLSVGYSPLVANVTNTVALVPGYFGGSVAYRAELEGQRAEVIRLGAISLVGAVVGAVLLLAAPASVFGRIVPWLILLACALLLAQPFVRRLVEKGEAEGTRHAILVLGAQFLAAVYGGYFGAGLGVLMLAFLGIFLHDTLQRLNALKGLLSLIINLASALFFVLFAPVAWFPVVIMALASLAGGHLGVQIARHLSNTLLRAVVILFGVAVAVKLLVS
jgi:uncharacterized membrane protein YfcA